VAYYNHRHSRIDETNILQVVKAVEGEAKLVSEISDVSKLTEASVIFSLLRFSSSDVF
jgi:hypothetical protein